MIKQPRFWQSHSLLPWLLWPASFFFWLGGRIKRAWQRPQKITAPVICIGNVTVGGAGKTPTAIAVANHFIAKQKKVVFVSRGYGGKLTGPLRVNPEQHTAQDVGDEPLLLAQIAPVWIGVNRYKTALLAHLDGADIIIMDDGFQNNSLYKDMSLLVIDGAYGLGNRLLLPAGPLRETFSSAQKKADAVVIIGESNAPLSSSITKPVIQASLTPATNAIPADKPVIAFAGIGRPEKFFQSLREASFSMLEQIPFPDHHLYTEEDLKQLTSKAKDKHAILVTTEKDMVRIPQTFADQIFTFPIEISWQDEKKLAKLLANIK